MAGSFHFASQQPYLKMMPPYIPNPVQMVMISGTAEIFLGFSLLVSQTQKLAAWGLILLLIAVFPANIYMAQYPELFPIVPRWGLYIRLPLQLVMIAWAYYYTRKVV